MTELEERKEAARQKIEKEMGETDTPLGQIGMILLAWLDYSDGAAEKINQESKTLDGAYKALRNHASKHKGKSMSPRARDIRIQRLPLTAQVTWSENTTRCIPFIPRYSR